MNLLNATRMQAGYVMGMEPSGRELLVVVVKGTFLLPEPGMEAELAAEQAPLIDSDIFTGEPGFSAPLYECDYAPLKPRCDVLLIGSAYAPGGRPARRVRVVLRVGSLAKQFSVIGNRHWIGAGLGVVCSSPEPFLSMPISYDRAFGGIDSAHPDPLRHAYYDRNHAGVGYHYQTAREFIDGAPLPNTEENGSPITDPRGSYRPMSFGSLARAWQPRVRFSGTYDENWLDNIFPFLPPDFDNRYYQAAPPDQQMDYPAGGEEVILENLTPSGYLSFQIPKVKVPVRYYRRDQEDFEARAVIDTIMIEPDLGRLTMTWRSSLALRRNMFEVEQVLAGEMPRSWHRARELGKTYYPSLGALVASKKGDD
jgi:hypothetical protein